MKHLFLCIIFFGFTVIAGVRAASSEQTAIFSIFIRFNNSASESEMTATANRFVSAIQRSMKIRQMKFYPSALNDVALGDPTFQYDALLPHGVSYSVEDLKLELANSIPRALKRVKRIAPNVQISVTATTEGPWVKEVRPTDRPLEINEYKLSLKDMPATLKFNPGQVERFKQASSAFLVRARELGLNPVDNDGSIYIWASYAQYNTLNSLLGKYNLNHHSSHSVVNQIDRVIFERTEKRPTGPSSLNDVIAGKPSLIVELSEYSFLFEFRHGLSVANLEKQKSSFENALNAYANALDVFPPHFLYATKRAAVEVKFLATSFQRASLDHFLAASTLNRDLPPSMQIATMVPGPSTGKRISVTDRILNNVSFAYPNAGAVLVGTTDGMLHFAETLGLSHKVENESGEIKFSGPQHALRFFARRFASPRFGPLILNTPLPKLGEVELYQHTISYSAAVADRSGCFALYSSEH